MLDNETIMFDGADISYMNGAFSVKIDGGFRNRLLIGHLLNDLGFIDAQVFGCSMRFTTIPHDFDDPDAWEHPNRLRIELEVEVYQDRGGNA